ncbi:MAG: hypothetical protein ACJ07L_16975, partial [Opitutales bacterium]
EDDPSAVAEAGSRVVDSIMRVGHELDLLLIRFSLACENQHLQVNRFPLGNPSLLIPPRSRRNLSAVANRMTHRPSTVQI